MTDRIRAIIDLGAIRANVAATRALVGPRVAVMAVLKADAYGHGWRPAAASALEAGVEWLGAACVSEGAEMRCVFPTVPICVFSPFCRDEAETVVNAGLTPFVGDATMLGWLASVAKRLDRTVDVHLDADTGMGRSGGMPECLLEAAARARSMPHVRITGVATHFPSAETDPGFTLRQSGALRDLACSLRALCPALEHVHCANSAGVLCYPEAHHTLVRPGLLLYGLLPQAPCPVDRDLLRPALTLEAQVVQVRHMPPGHTISYGRTRALTRASRVAVVAAGYGDGYPRELSGRGEVLVRGRRAPILGRVCMDVTLVDVTDVPGARAGDTAVLIGRQGDDCIRAEDLASLIGTTEHDITTRLTSRVPRAYVNA